MGVIRIRAAALIRRGNSVLMIEHGKNERRYWLLPGGGVEFGETVAGALEREMLEETNLQVKVGDLAFTSETIDPRGQRHVLHMVFWSEIVGGELHVGQEERLKSVRYVDIDELPNMVLHPPLAEHLVRLFKEDQPRAKHLGPLWSE
ncbi:MAG: NUDIX hydrolase [bacterium]|nr:NUDIX hydrolase [bacterium]